MRNVRARLPLFALVAAAVVAISSVARGEVPTGETIDGIRCDQDEGSLFHIHQHLTILYRGKALEVPGDVGRPVLAGCLYWLHTHETDGIIHVEAPVLRSFTLGNFFDIWGEPLSATAVAGARIKKGELRAFVDGTRYLGDPRKIELSLHADIVLEAGPPYVAPRPFANWGNN